jgi:hypothetical protein
MSEPITSIARYRVKPDSVDEFLEIVDRHWATLRELELVTEREPEVYLGDEKETSGPTVVEVFDWASPEAVGRAHTHPHVSEVWEAMGPLCEPRNGAASMEFFNARRLAR